MTYTTVNLRDYKVSRWRKLAEQRLEHVTELFVSGRWQRYFNEPDFLEIVRQTKDAVAAWRRLDIRPLETPMPTRPSISAAATERTPATAAATQRMLRPLACSRPISSSRPSSMSTELVSVAAVAELRPALRLPSPFEDTVRATALQRAARL